MAKKQFTVMQWWIAAVACGAICILTLCVLLSWHLPQVRMIGVLLTISLTGIAAGIALGFLFAVPRSAYEDVGVDKEAPVERNRFLYTNTTLSKVSDWLTTMLVGVGLTQLHSFDEQLGIFSAFLLRNAPAGGFANATALTVAGPLLLVFSVAIGFVLMYLNTRVNLVRLLDAAERVIGGLDEDVTRLVKEAAGGLEGLAAEAAVKSPNLSVQESLGVMFALLYHPKGYEKVISIGRSLLATPDAIREPSFWLYLAAAYGQQYSSYALEGEQGQNRATSRHNMLDAARRATQLDSGYKYRLWRLTDENSTDNDLAPFRNDQEFLEIVGNAAD